MSMFQLTTELKLFKSVSAPIFKGNQETGSRHFICPAKFSYFKNKYKVFMFSEIDYRYLTKVIVIFRIWFFTL